MIEAIGHNSIRAIGSVVAAEYPASSQIGGNAETNTPIQVNVRVRSYNGMLPAIVTPTSAASKHCPLAVGTLLDCYA
jgi:hypothetical protein